MHWDHEGPLFMDYLRDSGSHSKTAKTLRSLKLGGLRVCRLWYWEAFITALTTTVVAVMDAVLLPQLLL